MVVFMVVYVIPLQALDIGFLENSLSILKRILNVLAFSATVNV